MKSFFSYFIVITCLIGLSMGDHNDDDKFEHKTSGDDLDISNFGTGGNSIKFIGKAPRFKFFPNGVRNGDSRAFIIFSLDSIEEIEASQGQGGPPHKIGNLASDRKLVLTGPIIKELNLPSGAVNVTDVNFGGNPTNFPNTNISIDTYLFNGKQNRISYAGQQINLPPFSFKWSLYIKSWPFKSIQNSLKLSVSLLTPNTFRFEREERKYRNMTASINTGLSTALLDFPTVALVDGVVSNVTINTIGNTVEFIFPKFNELFYDPSISFSTVDTTQNGVVVVSSSSRIRLFIELFIFSIVIVMFI